MQIEAARDQVAARGSGARESPLIVIGADEIAAGGHARELLLEQAALASSAEAEFADELLVSGALSRGSADAVEELAVSGHRSFTMVQGLGAYHLSDNCEEKIDLRGAIFVER
jgi:hypothetical protein